MTSPSNPNCCLPDAGGNQERRSNPEPPPCSVCRIAARAGDKFCPECGQRLSEPPKAHPHEAPDGPYAENTPPKAGPRTPLQDPKPQQVPVPRPSAHVEPEHTPPPLAEPPRMCTCGQSLPPGACFCSTCGLQVGKPKPRRRLVSRKNGSPELVAEMADGELTIGKAPDCSLAVPGDDYLSRRHARVYQDDGMVFIEDLGSSNGTFLRVHRPIVLEPGDEILVGTTVLRFEQD